MVLYSTTVPYRTITNTDPNNKRNTVPVQQKTDDDCNDVKQQPTPPLPTPTPAVTVTATPSPTIIPTSSYFHVSINDNVHENYL